MVLDLCDWPCLLVSESPIAALYTGTNVALGGGTQEGCCNCRDRGGFQTERDVQPDVELIAMHGGPGWGIPVYTIEHRRPVFRY